MKVMFVGYHNSNFQTITEYIEFAFAKEGHECIPFDDRKFIIPGKIRALLPRLHSWDIERMNNKLIRLIESQEKKPDFCLVSGGHRIFSSTIKKIKAMGIKTVLWTIDPPADFQAVIDAAPFYEKIFCGGTEALELFAAADIKEASWLPFGFEDQRHHAVACNVEEEKKYRHDIVFIGSHYPNRLKILEEISNFNLGVWGPGWEKTPQESPLKPCIKGYQLKPDEWMKIFNSAKIIIVIHYQDGKIPCYQASPKVYEALVCGQFVLCDDQKDVKTLFQEGEHIGIFKSIADLKEKIQYYLDHPIERIAIGKAGKEEAVRHHTYRHRIRKIIDVMKS